MPTPVNDPLLAAPAAVQAHWHRAADGTRLYVRRLLPTKPTPVGQIVLVHGYMEHGGRYVSFAQALAAAGFVCTVLDLRGHGRSEGPKGHIERFAQYTDDVQQIVFDRSVPGKPLLFGHSLGGLIATAVAAQHSAALSGVLLSNPYLHNALPIPAAKRWLGRVAKRLYPRLRAPSGIRREWLLRDAAAQNALIHDPLVFDFATAGWFDGVQRAQAQLDAITALHCPLWMAIGEQDQIASPSYNAAFAQRLRTPRLALHREPQGLHELLQDTGKQRTIDEAIAFARACVSSADGS